MISTRFAHAFLRVFHHQYGIRARRQRCASHDFDSLPCGDGRTSRWPRFSSSKLANNAQRHTGCHIPRSNSVAVSRDSRKRRLVPVSDQRFCQSAAQIPS
jgi:hypothetical protein